MTDLYIDWDNVEFDTFPRARELAAQLLENSPSSVRLTKKLINGFLARSLDEQIAQAVEDNARIRTTEDFREGVTSFLEKRKPRWAGGDQS